MNIHIIHTLIKIKNAVNNRKNWTLIRNHKDVFCFLVILYKENFLQSFKYVSIKNEKYILVHLSYVYNYSMFKNLKIIATKSRTVYLTYLDLCKILNRNIFLLLTTSRGILTDLECKQTKHGGKLLLVC